VSSTVEREFAVNDPDAVLGCFEATAAAVFASLCRVSVGDRRRSERLLRETYMHLQRIAPVLESGEVELDWLILAANRLYLNDAESAAEEARGRREPHAMESDWTRLQWGLGLDALDAMSPAERVTLNLHIAEHLPLEDIADILHVTHAETVRLLADAQCVLTRAGVAESALDVLRTAEVWLDDSERAQVRNALTDRPRPTARARVRRSWSTSSIPVRAAVVATGIALTVFVTWVLRAPTDDGSRVEFAVPTTEPLSLLEVTKPDKPPKKALQLERGIYGTGTSRPIVNVTPTPGASGESLNVLAVDLSHEAEVYPDTIVKYSNGKVGITWTGPCNRPAARVQLSNLGDRVGLRLITGEFAVVSCVGMPKTWATVIETPMQLAAGPIEPFVANTNRLDETFAGYSQWTTSGSRTELFTDSVTWSSSLLDAARAAWTYVDGCRYVKWTEYDARQGNIFETTVVDEAAYVCGAEVRQRLITSDGRQFPHPDVSRNDHLDDCAGPAGSMTALDAGSQPVPGSNEFSMWDGCVVRSDVIEFTDYEGRCGLVGVRTITTADSIGSRMSADDRHVYLRDPDGAVTGDPNSLTEFNILPTGATDSGIRRGVDQIWLVPGDPAAIYVKRGVTSERWPLVAAPPSCP
jgi:hypothetical protein